MEKDVQQLVHLLGPWTTGQGPRYRLLACALHALIGRGDIAPGTRLPAERLLADALVISRSTVIAAYRLLEQEGWLERKLGSGTFVRALPSVEPMPHLLRLPFRLPGTFPRRRPPRSSISRWERQVLSPTCRLLSSTSLVQIWSI